MKPNRASLYITAQGPDEEAIKKGIQWLIELAESQVSKRSALVAIPIKANLEGVVSKVVGERVLKGLIEQGTVRFDEGIEWHLLTERTGPDSARYSWNGPILAIYATRRLLDKIDALYEVTDVLVIPCGLEEVQWWIDTWSARELGAEGAASPPGPRLTPVVKAALQNLTQRVNLSTGIDHPCDRDAAISYFRILRDAGIAYDPDQVRAHLVSTRLWSPRDADDVKKVAAGILAGKRLRGGRISKRDAAKVLKRWEEDAEKKVE